MAQTVLSNFTGYSTNLALVNAVERTFQAPSDVSGRVRVATFAYESSSATTDGSAIALCILPEGAKILHIFYEHEAFATTAALDLGLYTLDGTAINDALFVAADDISSAGTNHLYPTAGATTVGDDMYVTTQECVLTATAETANWAADKFLAGYVEYVVN